MAGTRKCSKQKPKSSKPSRERLTLPPVMAEFAAWLAKHDDYAVGSLEVSDEAPGEGHFPDPKLAAGFAAHAILFGRTGDGSEIVLVDRGRGLPQAVVFLNSEGGTDTVATSPEQFLLALAEGDTGVLDLDDEDATERKAFAAWVRKQKLKVPKAPPFDLGAFLEGRDPPEPSDSEPPKPVAGPPAPQGKLYDSMPPRMRRLAMLVGRRADDPELATFITGELKKKVPATLTSRNDYAWVEVGKKQGFDLLFQVHLRHDAYPEIPVSKSSFVPYLEGIHFRQSYKEPLLFGLSFDADVATLERHLGAPAGVREEAPGRPYWLVAIDQGRGLQFTADYYDGSPQMSLTIDEARELNNAGHSKPSVGLFVAWAIERGVLDPNRFGAWLPLIAKVKAREIQGSAFYDAALPRGLWDRHLVNRPGLRDFAFGWFHNIGVGGKYITSELIKVFGKYRHPHDYDEPNLTEDTWANVDRASPMLDRTFAKWLK